MNINKKSSWKLTSIYSQSHQTSSSEGKSQNNKKSYFKWEQNERNGKVDENSDDSLESDEKTDSWESLFNNVLGQNNDGRNEERRNPSFNYVMSITKAGQQQSTPILM